MASINSDSSESESEITKLYSSIINHLGDVHSDTYPWILKKSELGGRGLFATRDIEPHEIIFQEFPLILGPRANKNESYVCVVCYKTVSPVSVCNKNCSLSLCDDCQDSKCHTIDCELIRKFWPSHPTRISFTVLRSLTYLRAILLSKERKELLYLLQGNQNIQQDEEIDIIKKEFKNFPKDEETLKLLKYTSAVFNTNAFETMTGNEESKSASLRGLYPLAGLMNHNCIPNTRYTFQRSEKYGHIITFRAMRLIKQGEEMFNSYTKLLFATPFRRIFLAKTKNFMCSCERCSDPTVSII